jgi:hypothetical protein
VIQSAVRNDLCHSALDRYVAFAEQAYPHLGHFVVQIKHAIRARQ